MLEEKLIVDKGVHTTEWGKNVFSTYAANKNMYIYIKKNSSRIPG